MPIETTVEATEEKEWSSEIWTDSHVSEPVRTSDDLAGGSEIDIDDVVDQELVKALEYLKTEINMAQAALLKDYRPPSSPPRYTPSTLDLSEEDIWSLRLYATWVESFGTVAAFGKHRALLEAGTKKVLYSFVRSRNLARSLANLRMDKIHVCPSSHIAYTGEHSSVS